MPDRDHLAIVTGASSGIGEAAARQLAQRGWQVLAGVRSAPDAEALADVGIEPVILDITAADQIADVARRVDDDPEHRPLTVLINNAGLSLNAPIETLSIDRWRAHFEVNLFGHVALTQALLPALLTAHGRVINISSIGGLVALPTYGPYAAAKFALEGFSDALRRELAPSGVDVVVIEPGTTATAIWDKAITAMSAESAGWSDDQHQRYDTLMTTMLQQAQAAGTHGVSPADVAEVIIEAATAQTPETRYLIGEDATGLAQARRNLSDRELDDMLASALQ